LFERIPRHGAQAFQGQISLRRTLNEFFGDMFAALVVSAMRQSCESLFERYVHVGGCAFVDSRHRASSLIAETDSGRLRSGLPSGW
jgi:hypothetical protein